MLSNQIPHPDAKSFQDLLHTTPSLIPLPQFHLALELALEARNLQRELIKTEEKVNMETLIHELQKHNKEEGVDNTKVILRDLGISTGALRRVERSVEHLPEACKSDKGWVIYETAMLLIEYVEKLPPSELLTEFKTSAISATQQCTDESWNHLEKVGKQLIENPEIQNYSLPLEDQMYFAKRFIVLFTRIILYAIQRSWYTYFG